MTKVTYASLKLKTNTDVKTFDFNGKTIEVLQYLPVEDKYDLVNITLQEAKEGYLYHPVKLDALFHLNLVYMYTNLTFTDKQKENELELYDTLQSSGLIDQVLLNIDEFEYNTLKEYLEILQVEYTDYNNSINGIIQNIIESLPLRAEELGEILNNFDTEKFKEVMNFAKAANGGRPLV